MDLLIRSQYFTLLFELNQGKAFIIIAYKYICNKFSFESPLRKSIEKTHFKISDKASILFEKRRIDEEKYN
jgi:hypothetical protein